MFVSNAKRIFLLAILLSATARVEAQRVQASTDWLTWRGPNLNGIAASGQTPVVSWTETKNVIWKTPVPGRGHASPTIVGEKIFLASCDERSQTQSVIAFDRASGRQLWKQDINLGGLPKTIHKKNTHATPSVASDGRTLFVSFYNHESIQAAALSLDGKELWQQVVGPFSPRQYKYGYAASPMLYKSSILVVGDYDGDAWLAALDSRTGRTKWKIKRPGKLSWSSPVVAHIAGRDQLLLSGNDMVASYDPNNGQRLWATPATTMATCGTMIWEGDLVFASGGYPKSETVCIRADGKGQIVWRNNQKCYEQSMLVYQGYVYAVTDRGIAICWRAKDGREMWTARLPGGPVSASPILAGGNIYLSNERGTTYVFKANPRKFELVGQNQLGQEAFATPTICGNRIYLRVAGAGRQEMLYCIGEG